MDTFSASAMVRFGWETFKKRGWFLIGAFSLAIVAYSIVGQVITAAGNNGSGFVAFLAFILNFCLQTLLGMGLIAFVLKAHDNVGAAQFGDLWHPQPFLKYLGASIIYGIAALIGFILLIVPGVIVVLMYQFATYIVIDRGMGPIEALKESARITRGHRLELLALVVILALLNVLGALLVLVGLLVSIPVTALAMAHAYRTLSAKAGTPPVSA